MTLVLDASLTLAWVFEDETTEATDEIHENVAGGLYTRCPAHWPVEVANGLLVAERRKRIQASHITQFFSLLSRYTIYIEQTHRIGGESLLLLAREHGLSVYDAAYLELAMQRGAELATLDGKLREAGHRVGLTVLPKAILAASG